MADRPGRVQRALGAADADSAGRAEDAEALRTAPEWMQSGVLAQRFKTEWDGHSAFFMGAFDPELVGIIFCGRDGPSSVKISAFYVIPERRRRHVGLQLLDDAMARARRWTGLSRFWLDVPITNLPARELYLSRGFRVVGPGELHGEERMELDLR